MQEINQKQKSVVELALRVVEMLNGHSSHSEADSALVIARELLSLNKSSRGVFLGSSANDGLHKESVPI
jgi:hypothetical protein